MHRLKVWLWKIACRFKIARPKTVRCTAFGLILCYALFPNSSLMRHVIFLLFHSFHSFPSLLLLLALFFFFFFFFFFFLSRTMGVPSRQITTFDSAHESPEVAGKYKNKIIRYWDHQTRKLVREKGMIWNFHSWNEAFFSRNDMPAQYSYVQNLL